VTSAADATFMRRALELARRGRGMTHPNPLVGAVVVREGRIVGEGFHAVYGGPHAEVVALLAAGEKARGADLYVTLEPCTHHGKTPPCVDAIRVAGVARVVYAADDPDRDAAGGAASLAAAGISVAAGLERDAARDLNRIFLHVRERGTPFVSLKVAQSLDGGIAAAEGERTQLTGAEAQAETHRLRADHEAVLVGIRTARIDDPLLTVRGAACRVPPVRIVLDTHARLPLESMLMRTLDQAAVWVVCADGADAGRADALAAAGAMVLRASGGPAGLDLAAVHRSLGAAGVRSVLVEGGAAVAAGFLDAGLVDRLHLFVAPHMLGRAAVPGPQPSTPVHWQPAGVQRFGRDVLLSLDPAASPAESP
jgi:diaminohydroxyphosphoribosylaminopyrimidine deaminase / 5-amino-6-(5-phosphoribosylamino)uracil reductase